MSAQAFTPLAGTWVIDQELNGKPGRGLAIDVQNGTVVMQIYAYDKNGQPTFYMGSSSNMAASMAVVPLKQYQGGRYLGSGDRSATESASVGDAILNFSSATKGTIKLPGETEVAMSRFEFGYAPGRPESLLGTWVLTSVGKTSAYDFVEWAPLSETGPATPDGSGTVWTKDFSIGCEQKTSGGLAGTTFCAIFSGDAIVRAHSFPWAIHDGEGSVYDRSGNFLGVSLAKRIRDDKGTSVGFLRSAPAESSAPSKAESAEQDARLRAFEQASQQVGAP
ncbi:hypothetical protein GCM10027082_38730 [Comamonas humi]